MVYEDVQAGELLGKFHSHITINSSNEEKALCILRSNSIQAKSTTITLSGRGRDQTDTMLTQHFHTYKYKCYQSIEDYVLYTANILESNGVNVVRIKIEHESLPTLQPSEDRYRECHIKLKIPNDEVGSVKYLLNVNDELFNGFALSNNPNEVTTKYTTLFLNSRVYEGSVEGFDNRVKGVVHKLRLLGVLVVEVKIESTTLDTRLSLDKWWA